MDSPKITVDLEPGERVKVIIRGAYLSGEVVCRSKDNPNEWIIRTYFHNELKCFDDLCIVSDRREQLYEQFFSRGTIVEIEGQNTTQVGVIVGSVKQALGDSFVYLPVVLIGTKKMVCSPENLRIVGKTKKSLNGCCI